MNPNESSRWPGLRFAIYTSSRGNYFFHEIAGLIGAGLEELGLKVRRADENSGFRPDADWHLIVAPHEFFQLGPGEALAEQRWPSNVILFNTEQPSTQWFALAAKRFPRARCIWDLDFESSLRIARQGFVCRYLPLGFAARSPMFRSIPVLPLHEGTREIAPEVRQWSGLDRSWAERPLDLLFLGHSSPRREQFFTRHAVSLNQFRSYLHKSNVSRPLIPGQTTSMNTETSIGLAQRSKVLLNVHHGVDKYFEWHRIVLLGVAQRALVITEPCSLAPPFQAGCDYVEAPLDELPEQMAYYLGSDAGRHEAQAMVDRAYLTLTKRCCLSDMLSPLLSQLVGPAPEQIEPSTVRTSTPVPQPDMPVTSRPLSICVVTSDVTGEGREVEAGAAQIALAEALAVGGHQVTLLHTSDHYGTDGSIGSWLLHFAARGLRYVALPSNPRVPIDAYSALARSYLTWEWLRSQRFDCVHFPDSVGSGYYSLLGKRQGLGLEHTCLCVHAMGPSAWRRQGNGLFLKQASELEIDFLERESIALAEALSVPTQYLLRWLNDQQWTLPKETAIRPIPWPRQAENVSPTHSEHPMREVRELVFLGTPDIEGGFDLFCDALDELAPEDLRRVTVTVPQRRGMMHRRKSDHYLRERSLKWPDGCLTSTALDPIQLGDYLQRPGGLAVMPATIGNSPDALRRCLALGIPFLIHDCGGMAELIDPNDHTATLFKGTAKDLARALTTAIRAGVPLARATLDRVASAGPWLQWHEQLALAAARQQQSSCEEASHGTKASPAGAASDPSGTGSVGTAQPLVSVCLVHFNRPEYLRQALASLQAQDYPNFEIVLVDDGSTRPEAVEYLASLEPLFRERNWQLIRQENRYLGAARNTAARHARGEYLLFMDDDNYAKPSELSTFVRVARKTGADILTSAMDLFTGAEAPRPGQIPKARWIFLGAAAAAGVFRNVFGDANALVRREAFWRVGGFTEDYGVTHEDWEFHARAILQGCRMEFVPEALFWYRYASGSMIHQTPKFANHQRSLRPYLESVPKPLRELLQFAQGQKFQADDLNSTTANYEFSRRLLRSLLASARHLAELGQNEAADAAFMEVLKCGEGIQNHGLHLDAFLLTGKILAELQRDELALKLIERGLKLAQIARHEPSIKAARLLLETVKRGSDVAAACAGMSFLDAESDTIFLRRPPAGATPVLKAAPADVRALAEEPVLGAPASRRREDELSPLSPPSPVSVPVVSIVIPTFNQLRFTQQCLQALARHTPVPHEVIIVDNGSADGTPDFLRAEEKAGRLRALLNVENLGFARACNQGAHKALGRFVLFLNNDTEVEGGWLEPLVSLLERDPVIAAAGGKLLFPDRTIQHAGVVLGEVVDRDPLLAAHVYYKAPANLPEANHRRVYQALSAACVLVRKTFFDSVGGFDEGYFNGYEDIDLCLQFQRRGWFCVYEPGSVVVHHESQSGPARFQRVQDNIRRLHRKWLGEVALDVVIRPNGGTTPLPTNRIQAYEVPPATATTSIIVLTHNQLAHTKMCLESIRLHTPQAHEIIVVDNGSTDGTVEFLGDLASRQSNLRVIFNPTNRGFAAGNNQGLAVARGESILLLNNDTIVTPGWLERMLAVFADYPRTGLVGPMSNYVSGRQLIPDVAYTTPEQLLSFAATWTSRHERQRELVSRLVGFCLLIRRNVIDRIGGLDEDFGSGNFEDDDYCLRAGLAGFESCIARDSFVHHTGNQTFKGAGIDYRASMLRNWELFKSKWGLPPEASVEKGYRLPLRLADTTRLRIPLPNTQETSPVQPASHDFSPSENADVPAAATETASPAELWPAARIELPPVALLGNLSPARQSLRAGELVPAWSATLAALETRPFHPEAWLLLAEIAATGGDQNMAKVCAARAEKLTPKWRVARKFLKKHPVRAGVPRIAFPPLPELPAEPRLSVCLIVKNEERFLSQCLASIIDVATQIIVVDTGSTDGTVDIAREFEAEVSSVAWTDDFSAARNAALEAATGDWVLILDADEVLRADDVELLRKEMTVPSVIAYRLPIVDVGREDEGGHYVPRLFRNAPGLFFVGRVHEQVFSSVEVRRREWDLENRLGKVTLLHYGYGKDVVRSRDKIARNLRLLEQAITELPGEPNLLMNLGLELVRSDRPEEGRKRYWEAVRVLSALPPADVVPELRETLLTQFATHLLSVKDYSGTNQLLRSPLAKAGGLTASLHFLLGLALMEQKEFSAAADEFRQCLQKRHQPSLAPIATEIRLGGPRHCLALCCKELKQVEAAAKAFREAMLEAPTSRPLRHDYARFLAEHNEPVEAFKLWHQLVGDDAGDVLAWMRAGQIALSHPSFIDFACDWTGEAFKHLPDRAEIILQRAEALLLSEKTAESLALWRRAASAATPFHIAGRVLCELAEDEESIVPAALEPAVSREFIKWYRRLLDRPSSQVAFRINERLDKLRRVLPAAAETIGAVLVSVV